MKIGIVSPTFPPMAGGVSYYVYNLSKELVKKKHKVVVFTRGSYRKTLYQNIEGVDVFRIPFIPSYPFHVHLHGLFLERIFNGIEENLDLLHTHTPLSPVLETSLPKVVTVHGLPELSARKFKSNSPRAFFEILFSFMVYRIQNGLLHAADKVTSVSFNTKKELMHYFSLEENGIRVIGNGVDESFFHPKKVKEEDLSILYAGRLDYKKGLIELVHSAKEICMIYSDVIYKIVGMGPLYNELRSLIKNEGLHDKFRFYGHVDRNTLRELYRESSVFILPSYYEGLPNVILEAMACGLPIVATKVGGIAEVLHHRVNGLLISPGDEKAITDSLDQLLGDDDLRYRMGTISRLEVEKHYTWGSISDQYLQLYEELLDQS